MGLNSQSALYLTLYACFDFIYWVYIKMVQIKFLYRMIFWPFMDIPASIYYLVIFWKLLFYDHIVFTEIP